MGRIADFPGDSKRKRSDTAEKSGDLPEKLNRVRSLSLFGGGIQRKPRVIRGALPFVSMQIRCDCPVAIGRLNLCQSMVVQIDLK
jgi:hypothetical protein